MLPCDEFYWSRGTSYLSAADCCAASLSNIVRRGVSLHDCLELISAVTYAVRCVWRLLVRRVGAVDAASRGLPASHPEGPRPRAVTPADPSETLPTTPPVVTRRRTDPTLLRTRAAANDRTPRRPL